MDELTTPEGFLLRPWEPSDASAVLRAFAPAEMDRQTDRPVFDRPGALTWIADRTRERGARTGYSWAVVGEAGEALGCVAVGAVNLAHDTGWVSYWTTEEARGRGVAPADVRALARWAFDEPRAVPAGAGPPHRQPGLLPGRDPVRIRARGHRAGQAALRRPPVRRRAACPSGRRRCQL